MSVGLYGRYKSTLVDNGNLGNKMYTVAQSCRLVQFVISQLAITAAAMFCARVHSLLR